MRNLVKKTSLLFSILCLSYFAQAQTLTDAVKLYQYNRFESAKNILIPLASGDPMANYYLGLCEIGLENYNGAKAIFQKFPDDPANQAGIARIFFIENKAPEAMSMLNSVVGKAKKKNYFPLQYAADAITYTDGGDPNMAVEWYKKAMESERTGPLHIGIGDVYRKIQGGGGNAMTNYEYAEQIPAYASLANFKKGDLWYAAKNYDSALSNYARANSLDESNPLPYKALADAYYNIKQYKLSKENIEKYLALSDKSIDDQIQYANTLFLAKEYQTAVNKMQELIGKGVEKAYMYRVIAFSQLELKDYANAKMNMDKFFKKQDPKKVIPLDYINYGKLMLKDSLKKGEANSYFEKGIAIDTASDKAPTYRSIAEAYNDAEEYLNSGIWYKKIIDSNSPSTEAVDYWWSGVMYYYGKDYANAEAVLNTFAEKYPAEPTAILWQARTIETSKDKEYKNGAATEKYKNWLTMINEDPAKKKDLIKAYTYLSLSAYNMNNKTDALLYSNKLIAIDPGNSVATQIISNLK